MSREAEGDQCHPGTCKITTSFEAANFWFSSTKKIVFIICCDRSIYFYNAIIIVTPIESLL